MTHIRPFDGQDRAQVARLNVEFYRARHGFDATFADAVEAALDAIAHNGMGWVVEDAGQIAGSLFLGPDGADSSRLRLFLLRPDLQGQGLGRDLLRRAISAAPTLGVATLHVSTFDVHEAACALYAAEGFTQMRRTKTQAFGQSLTRLDFQRDTSLLL